MHDGSFLFFDAETFSAAKLDVVGTWQYVTDPSTEITCVAYALNDAAPKIWLPGQPVPEEFNPEATLVAHNFMFERTLLTHILGPRHGFPEVPLSRQACTMTMALASALPGALANATLALGLEYQKDREGYTVMRQMTQPMRTRKGEGAEIRRDTDPDKLKVLYRYAKRDVAVTRELFHRLPLLSEFENTVWQLDAVINTRGFHIDTELAAAARDIAKREQKAINAAIAAVTDGAVLSVHQRDKIIAFVRAHGHTLQSLTKRSVSAVLAHKTADDQVRQLLELRREGARASTHKLSRLLQSVSDDNRMRGTLRFHGSSTGRWAGRGFQPQNLKKPETKDLDAAVGAILSGDLIRVRALGPALTIAGDVSRAMITAAPGHVLISADFSSIEARVLAWLAGETWELDTYRAFDATGRPELESYCVVASKIFKRTITPDDEAERNVGKTCVLAFGYGGALGAWRKFDSSDTYSDAEVEAFKSDWRRAHPATTRFWKALERTVHRAAFSRSKHTVNDVLNAPIPGGQITCHTEGDNLQLTLPSGRQLAYPCATLGEGKFEGTRELRFKDNAKGGWSDVSAWYGKLVENVDQAVSRDLLAAAMLRVEAAGYKIVLHVHDEVVAEVPEGFGSPEEFLALLVQAPEWAADLPIAAKVRTGKRYVKTKAPAPESVAEKEAPDNTTGPTDPTDADDFIGSFPIDDTDDGDQADAGEEIEDMPALEDLIGEPTSNGFISCPFHDDLVPSLKIYADHYHCHSCGAHGYAFDWLTRVQGMSESEARRYIREWDGPVVAPPSEADAEWKIRNALQLFDEAGPIAGTMAERYLAGWRGIDVTALPPGIGDALRFHPRCPFQGIRYPCLLALMRDPVTDIPCGVHRTALGPDGNRIERAMLGRAGAVKLWPADSMLVSARVSRPCSRPRPGFPTWRRRYSRRGRC
jgi:DNA polymerase family A/CHC2 zinc finger